MRRRLMLLIIAILWPAFASGTSLVHAAAEPVCFPESGQCVSGRFREFWEQQGGLATFGFPISPASFEVSRETGLPYLTQWFQRNRFELHPEQDAPYDVLLGRLGDDRLIQQHINWRGAATGTTPIPDCLWFEQTHHSVCNQAGGRGFMDYWQNHGLDDQQLDSFHRSLALFGLPLTEPRMETNTSGDRVLTQWFERARFEWHPDMREPYTILLGLLGNELRAGIHMPASGRIATPTPAPSATTVLTPSPTKAAPTASPTATPSATATPTPSSTTTPSATAAPTPSPTTAPTTTAPPAMGGTMDPLKQELWNLVDQLHQAAGCQPLRFDSRIAIAAQAHDDDIAAHQRIDHVGTDGATVRQRLARVGYPVGFATESIAVYRTPAEAVAAWMDEPPDGPHRLNITSCRYIDAGVGYAVDSRDWHWWVMDFANQRTGN